MSATIEAHYVTKIEVISANTDIESGTGYGDRVTIRLVPAAEDNTGNLQLMAGDAVLSEPHSAVALGGEDAPLMAVLDKLAVLEGLDLLKVNGQTVWEAAPELPPEVEKMAED